MSNTTAIVRRDDKRVRLIYDTARRAQLRASTDRAPMIPGMYLVEAESALVELTAIFEALDLRHAAIENIEARLNRIDRVLATLSGTR